MKNRPYLLCSLAGLALWLAVAPTMGADNDPITQATALDAKGDFDAALPVWRSALAEAKGANNTKAELQASLGLADAEQALGDYRTAEDLLEKADKLAKQGADKAIRARIESGLGEIYMLSPNPDDAEGLLTKSADFAKETGDGALIAATLDNLANFDAYQKKDDQAIDEYTRGVEAARNAGNKGLALKIEGNLIAAAVDARGWDTAQHWAEQAVEDGPGAPDSHDKAMALLGAGRAFLARFLNDSGDNDLRLKAFGAYQMGEKTATAIQDLRALSYALGYEGELYRIDGKTDDALLLSRHAAILAQEAKSPDILFRWQWQIARIIAMEHKREEAITAYQSAIATLQTIRHDMALHYGNITYGSSFRAAAGNAYFELADLLLQRADAAGSSAATDAEIQADLLQARDTVEELKSAELEDYFQDDCANLLKARTTKVENISNGALVVYIIPLESRTEILVTMPGGRIERVKSPASAAQLEETATTFRYNLENRSSYEFLTQGAQLYDWLIRPMQPLLDKTKIDTLVFIPDGALRTIPMGALYDGGHFLIEKYAVATTPGLTLMDAKPLTEGKPTMVIDALTQGVQGFAPLNYVKDEAGDLHNIYGGKELVDQNFSKTNVQQEFAQDSYSIVHIASHGHFDSDVRKTFILTYDGKLSLDEMEEMIRPSQLRDQPVEMLTLSACQTAAGDDRAALGLAGVAVKAGARSAFATLWFVNDQASSQLVADFYANLHNIPGVTKAKALQMAQVKLLSDPRYDHPCYWAPYMIIGNWL